MVRSLEDEVDECLAQLAGDERMIKVSLATGVLAGPILQKQVDKVKEKFPNVECNVYVIQNDFFGRDITVAGLLTGQDIINQLKDKQLGDALLLPNVLLRSGEEVLLDDLTVTDLEKALQIQIRIVKSDGTSLIDTILND